MSILPRSGEFAPRHKPKFTGNWYCSGTTLGRRLTYSHPGALVSSARSRRSSRTSGAHMPQLSLISVVEDDQFFRESMRRLMRSLGYDVATFPSAADFLASPRLADTACLIADIHMPAMSGLELNEHLIETGYAIPTILVTAYPDDVDHTRALNGGVICYLRKPFDEHHLVRCLRAALQPGTPSVENP
jgi:CheY-like chemotaxis protein